MRSTKLCSEDSFSCAGIFPTVHKSWYTEKLILVWNIMVMEEASQPWAPPSYSKRYGALWFLDRMHPLAPIGKICSVSCCLAEWCVQIYLHMPSRTTSWTMASPWGQELPYSLGFFSKTNSIPTLGTLVKQILPGCYKEVSDYQQAVGVRVWQDRGQRPPAILGTSQVLSRKTLFLLDPTRRDNLNPH